MMRQILVLCMALVPVASWASEPMGMPDVPSEDAMVLEGAEVPPWQGVLFDLGGNRDSDGFKRTTLRVGAPVRYDAIHDFWALGASSDHFSKDDWDARVNSIVAMVRKVDPATGAGFTARAAVAFTGGDAELHGEGVWNHRFSNATGAEFIFNRDVVETAQALEQSLLANFFAVSLDHAFTDRLTVIGMPTYRYFDDGNQQLGLRGWLIYNLSPEQGLSVNIKARTYESSENGGGVYFSPDTYQRVEAGLRLRRSLGNWRVYATADVGREWIDEDIEKPTTHLSLAATRRIGESADVGVQWAYYRASDSAANLDVSGSYKWRMARIYLSVPF